MYVHVTIDMTEIDAGGSPSNGREGNIFIDKQVQAHSSCSFGITFYNFYCILTNTLN